MHVYLNGQMIDDTQAVIAADDAGIQHAVGLFETLGVYHGRAFRLQRHVDRLAASAKHLGLTRQPDTGLYREAVQQTIDHNQLDRARIRLTVTAGRVSLLQTTGSGDVPAVSETVLVVPSSPTEYDPAYFSQGIMVRVGPAAANPFDPLAGHKTLAYWQRLMTLRQAASVGAGESIWLNTSNHLASGAVSNLFLVKDGRLLTPFARGEEVDGALPAPVLPGTTRAALIDLAVTLDIPVTRRMLSVGDLLDADEVFLTNASWLVLPVAQVEKTPIGDGQVGPVTRRLRSELLGLIERETKAPCG